MTLPQAPAWIAPCVAMVAGMAAAALCLLLPQAMLEDWVWQSGLPGLIAAAEPPLGGTARAVLALGGGGLVAAVTWSALFLLIGPDGLLAPRPVAEAGVPVLRRADAHPDAPARRPLSAADLGAPMPPMHDADAAEQTMDSPEEGESARHPAIEIDPFLPTAGHPAPPPPPPPPVVQALPADLDVPLAAFHPGALPAVPREPVRPVASLRSVALAEGERIDTVELPQATSESPMPSIESLLRRLEQSSRRPLRT